MDLDLLDLYGRASDWTSTKGVGATSQLDEPTTCDGWDVRTLLNHMLQTQRYFVGSARGEDVAPPGGTPPDPLLPALLSQEYAVIAVAVLGVLSFSSEFGTGLIRTTFAAMPRRRAVLAAKATVTGVVTLIAGEVVAFSSFFADQAVLSGHHLGVSLSRPGVPGAVLAAGALLCVCALIGVALGAIVRHTAGGIAAAIGVIVLPAIVALLRPPWSDRIGRFTLLDAARQVTALHPQPDLFTPAGSVLVLLAWPAVALAAAALLITRRDV